MTRESKNQWSRDHRAKQRQRAYAHLGHWCSKCEHTHDLNFCDATSGHRDSRVDRLLGGSWEVLEAYLGVVTLLCNNCWTRRPRNMKVPRLLEECQYHGLTEHVPRSRGDTRCCLCYREDCRQRHAAQKQRALDLLGGKCQTCGYDKCPNALDFHHRDPLTKNKTVADLLHRDWELVEAEVAKCDLLCANCHRELHANLKIEETKCVT